MAQPTLAPYPICIDCRERVDPDSELSLAEVVGFKRKRKGGGQNHVIEPQETGRWLCGRCAQDRQRGLRGQNTLW